MKILSILLFSCWAVLAVNAKATPRISNRGEVASEGEFPYQVSLQVGRQHACGGSLISKTHVLTAAHCVQQFVDGGGYPEPATIEVGMTRLGLGTKHQIKRTSYYRKYKGETENYLAPNDIPVIHLATPVITSDKVATINLPAPHTSSTPIPVGTEVILSGFGSSYVGGPMSAVLKKMDAKITPLNECNNHFYQMHKKLVTADKICAAKQKDYGACKGDSGGPLVDKTKTTILGVVSAGDLQCSNGKPDSYTDVAQFIDYINEELNYDPNNPASGNQNPAINSDGSSNQNPSLYPGYPQIPGIGEEFNFPNPGNPFYPQNPQQPPSGIPGFPFQFPTNPFEQIIPGQGIFGIGQEQSPFGSVWYGGLQKTVSEHSKE